MIALWICVLLSGVGTAFALEVCQPPVLTVIGLIGASAFLLSCIMLLVCLWLGVRGRKTAALIGWRAIQTHCWRFVAFFLGVSLSVVWVTIAAIVWLLWVYGASRWVVNSVGGLASGSVLGIVSVISVLFVPFARWSELVLCWQKQGMTKTGSLLKRAAAMIVLPARLSLAGSAGASDHLLAIRNHEKQGFVRPLLEDSTWRAASREFGQRAWVTFVTFVAGFMLVLLASSTQVWAYPGRWPIASVTVCTSTTSLPNQVKAVAAQVAGPLSKILRGAETDKRKASPYQAGGTPVAGATAADQSNSAGDEESSGAEPGGGSATDGTVSGGSAQTDSGSGETSSGASGGAQNGGGESGSAGENGGGSGATGTTTSGGGAQNGSAGDNAGGESAATGSAASGGGAQNGSGGGSGSTGEGSAKDRRAASDCVDVVQNGWARGA